jgi:MYXO-CTERM domain-containing protein
MNMKKSLMLTAALVAASAAPGIASASLVLDTGTPTSSAMPMLLDGTDYYAAEFNLTAGQTVTGIQAYVEAGLDQPGDTFTVALYGSDLLTSRTPTQLIAGQATYQQDGWTGLSGLSFTAATTGTYWAAFEVGSNDSAIGLALPSPTSGGTAPALDFASTSTGPGGYSDQAAAPFGVQVTVADAAPVPLPPAVWLFGTAMLGFGALVRRRRPAVF